MPNNKRPAAGEPTQNGADKGPTPAASPVATLNGAKTFFEREKKIIELLNEHVKDNSGKRAYEQIEQDLQQKTQEAQDLKSQLETLRGEHQGRLSKVLAELSQQKTLVQHLHASHESRVRELDAKSLRDNAELAALSTMTKELAAELTGARETLNGLNQRKNHLEVVSSRLRKEIDKANEKITEYERQCKIQQLQIEQLTDDLNKSRKTSRDLNDQLGGLPLDKVSMATIPREENFENLATRFHDLVWRTFGDRNLRFSDNHNLPCINASSQSLSGIPQLASNSMPARYMRCAQAEAVISEVLSTHVFSNRSLATARIKSNGGDDTADLGAMVTGVEMLSSRGYSVEATIIQWQLVKVCQQLQASRRTVSKATQAVCEVLDPWLVGGDSQENGTAANDAFAEQLKSLFSEAADLWQTLQRTRANATAVIGNVGGDWDYEEDSWQEYNDIETPTAGKGGSPVDDLDSRRRWSSLTNGHPISLPIASLFPRILAGNTLSANDDNIIFRGYALFPMQRVLLAAREEFAALQEQQMRSTPPPMTRRNSVFSGSRRRVSRVERPTGLSSSLDGQKIQDREGPSQQKQAESQLPPVGTAQTVTKRHASTSSSTRRLSISSWDGGIGTGAGTQTTLPLQQRSTLSDSDKGSAMTASSSHRSPSRREGGPPPNPTMSESSHRNTGRRSGRGPSGDRGKG